MNNRIFYIPREKKYTNKKKSIVRIRVIISIIFFVCFVIASIVTMRLSALQIQQISITGLSAVREEDVQKEIMSALSGSYLAGLIPYRFLLVAPAQIIGDTLKQKFPLIAEVTVVKEFPNKLVLAVKERVMFGILCNDAVSEDAVPDEHRDIGCSYLDTAGIAYDKAPQTQGFLIMKISTNASEVVIGSRAIDSLMMGRIKDINSKLPSVINSPIVGYQLLRNVPREVRAMSKSGFSLMINRDDDLDHALYVLKTVLEKEIGSRRNNLDYVDLRFGNKVFYKFK